VDQFGQIVDLHLYDRYASFVSNFRGTLRHADPPNFGLPEAERRDLFENNLQAAHPINNLVGVPGRDF
jgi:hypothetical protein